MAAIHGKNYGEPTLDLNFAGNKSLVDTTTEKNYVTFSRAQSGNEATYIGSDGLIKYAAADEARFDHDPATLESLGLLIEEARTNLIENSVFSVFSDWQYSDQGTLVADQALSPDGTTTAAEYTQSAQYQPAILLGFTQSSPLTFLCFVKPVNGDVWDIGSLAWNTYGKARYTFSTQQWSGSGLPQLENYGVEELADGWYRLWVVFGATATGGNTLSLRCADTDISGIQGYLWGAQLESGSFPTSYIPTAGTAATRAADICSIEGGNFSSWYNQNEGTMFESVTLMKSTNSGFFNFISSDGSRWQTFLYNSFSQIRSQLSAAGNSPKTTIIANTVDVVNKFAVTQSATSSDFALAANGGSVVYGDYNAPGTFTGIELTNANNKNTGGSVNNNYQTQLSGHISRLTYYPKRLPDIELQQLTK